MSVYKRSDVGPFYMDICFKGKRYCHSTLLYNRAEAMAYEATFKAKLKDSVKMSMPKMVINIHPKYKDTYLVFIGLIDAFNKENGQPHISYSQVLLEAMETFFNADSDLLFEICLKIRNGLQEAKNERRRK